ncbi:DUF4405 domain-containing protein [Desulfoluna spongiiphila]|uniref:DUF4405 domain-containing protein n=1 Tax=Desulfoluna spongiiphila TaxID=419481 RepID=UPI001251214D|nr:DUF4405 domain-containing protein [Desulfoluna spongiiphila]VVS90942.1 consensus disorder prediction [Desulfoluna spongiiphila]
MSLKKTTSLTLLFSFVVLTVSSIVLYVMPHGRVAYWADWHFWGLAKGDWDNIHINSGLLFLAAACLHLVLNWHLILAYVGRKVKGLRHVSVECAGAFVLTLAVVLGTVLMLPPFTFTVELSDTLKDRGERRYGTPPYGHAELSSIDVLSRRMGLDPGVSLRNLAASGMTVAGGDRSLRDVAQENRTTPKAIYDVMRRGQSERKKGRRTQP